MLEDLGRQSAAAVAAALAHRPSTMVVREAGIIKSISGSIVRISGLPRIGAEELIRLPGGLSAMAIDLDESETGAVLLGNSNQLKAGDEVSATGRMLDIPVGNALLGRVITATGRPLDDSLLPADLERLPVERDAPAIMARAPVRIPLLTGLKVVDALIPIGRGQRELIIGDRQTGKTAIALSAILNQRHSNTICIYCAIGQRSTAVARVIDTLHAFKAMKYTLVMVASGEDPPGLQYITPYAAMTVAEYFMAAGRDVLIVFDDLTRHARAYRELSLLLRRPPGREAYPGDIFYTHSRLLERATHLRPELGGGSITALPIIETQAGDISAYIPTNLISITDGQINLSSTLSRRGFMPAVDVGKSVSRVGGKTQLPAYRKVAGDLRLSYAQFQELETFSRFGTRLDDNTRMLIERGRRVREILKQGENSILGVAEQIAVLYAATRGFLDAIPLDEIAAAETTIGEKLPVLEASLCKVLAGDKDLAQPAVWEKMDSALRKILQCNNNGGDQGEVQGKDSASA